MASAKGVSKINFAYIWRFFLILGLLILLLSIFLIEGILENTRELEGTIGFNLISVKAKEDLTMNQAYGFTKDDIFDLKHRLKENLIIFSLPFETNLETRSNVIRIKALAVDSLYKNIAKINIIRGSFLTEKQEKNKERVVVIDEETAYDLFKSIDVVGMNITLMGKAFKIVGISKGSNTFLANLLKRKKTQIYIPLQTIFDFVNEPINPYFQIATSDNNGIQNRQAVVKMLQNMGKASSNYRIVDHRSFQKRVSQITQLLTYVFGMFIIYYLIKSQLKTIIRVYLIIKNNYQRLYFFQIIKSNRRVILYLIIQLFFWIFCSYIVYKVIKFDFYLPEAETNYFLYYLNLFADNFFEIGTSRSILESIPYFPEFMITLILIFGIPFGSILLAISFYSLKHSYQPMTKGLLDNSLSYLISLLLSSLIIIGVNLPVVINIKQIIIIFFFLYLKTLHHYT